MERIRPTLHNMKADAFSDCVVCNDTEIDTPFITTKLPGDPMTPDQQKPRTLTDEVKNNPANGAVAIGPRRVPSLCEVK